MGSLPYKSESAVAGLEVKFLMGKYDQRHGSKLTTGMVG